MATEKPKTPAADGSEVLRLVGMYFKQQGQTGEQIVRSLQELASAVQRDGVRLVHLGNTIFTIIVKGKGFVEIHAMPVDETASSLAKNIVALMKYLKNIGVRVAYTYDQNRQYAPVMKKTHLPFKTQQVRSPEDGKTYTAYYLEMKS